MRRILRGKVRRGRTLLTGTVVVLLAAAATGTWLLLRDPGEAAAAATTVEATVGTMKETVSASGSVSAASTADLDFAVSGTVTAVDVRPGDTVKRGQRLARIDDRSFQARLAAAQASLDAAEAQLAEDDDASDVQAAADQTAVVSAQAALEEAEQAVEDTVLRSTIAGTVTTVDLEVGDVVGSGQGAGGTGGTGTESAAVTVVSAGTFVVDATVPPADVARVKAGLQAEITVTGVGETVYGTVASVGLVAETNDSGAAVFPVTIEVTGQRDDLYAGVAATASIIVAQAADVLTVASRAVQSDDDGSYVEKVVDGRAVRTAVEVGTVYGAQTQILSGLAEGDTVEVPGLTLPAGGRGGSGEGQQFRMPGGQGIPGRQGFPGGQGIPGGGMMLEQR